MLQIDFFRATSLAYFTDGLRQQQNSGDKPCCVGVCTLIVKSNTWFAIVNVRGRVKWEMELKAKIDPKLKPVEICHTDCSVRACQFVLAPPPHSDAIESALRHHLLRFCGR